MAKKVTRDIKPTVQRELWARAGGRCQFDGCNVLLYRSAVTSERVNISDKAHIYSFSEDGPRGQGGLGDDQDKLNGIENLMLVCHGCHKKIDKEPDGGRYAAALLKQWKLKHEERIRIVTGICPSKNSHVVLYGGKIGEEHSPLQPDRAMEAMFPDWYPADERAIELGMRCEHEDKSPEFWLTEAAHLRAAFERHISPRIAEAKPNHFSIFALADQPLLVLLGSLLTDKVPAVVYQPHREPVSWKWQQHPEGFKFIVNAPQQPVGEPALLISLSARIHTERVSAVLSEGGSIWEITIDDCHNDFLRSEAQLAMFREEIRRLMVQIRHAHPSATKLNVFPAMPASCAVELGRVRMPKADIPWMLYDQNNKLGKFIPTIEIGGRE